MQKLIKALCEADYCRIQKAEQMVLAVEVALSKDFPNPEAPVEDDWWIKYLDREEKKEKERASK